MRQLQLIERLRAACAADERIVAALMYGSFTKGEGDRFSDIEAYLFVREPALVALDPAAWVAGIAPVALYLTNEFGSGVAIFEELIRGEFHFESEGRIEIVAGWGSRGEHPRPEQMILLDRDRRLREALERWERSVVDPRAPVLLQRQLDRLINWLLFGSQVLRRGERARALEILGPIRRLLLHLARAAEGAPHRQTPSRRAEQELSATTLDRLGATTATLDPLSLRDAYAAALDWTRELAGDLARTHPIVPHAELLDRLATLQGWSPGRAGFVPRGAFSG